jgi:hypothetical protein
MRLLATRACVAIALIAIALGSLVSFTTSVASAYSSDTVGTGCDNTEFVRLDLGLATDGYGLAWQVSAVTHPSHVAPGTCTITGSWPESSMTQVAYVQRQTISGTVTCYYNAQTAAGGVSQSAYQAANNTGVCDSGSWPFGYTKACAQATAYHSGTAVPTNLVCTTD